MEQQIAEDMQTSRMPGHSLLGRLGKRVLRPGGLGLTHRLLAALHITRTDEVVEFAPGMGATARMTLSRTPSSYTAVERDGAMAAIVEESIAGPTAKCVVGSAEQTGLPSQSATVVYGEAMLTMQRDDVKRRIIREALRLLKPGGRYGIHEMTLCSDAARASVERALSAVVHHGVKPLTIDEWTSMLNEEGFEVQSVATAPMHLLEPLRVIRDEGLGRAVRFAFNVLRDREARSRIRTMRSVFRQHRSDIAAVAIVAVRPLNVGALDGMSVSDHGMRVPLPALPKRATMQPVYRNTHSNRSGMAKDKISSRFLAVALSLLAASAAMAATGIARDPADVPPPVGSRAATVVKVPFVTKEVTATLDPATGATYRYWTFNGKVPGPMIRVRQGDTVEVTLHNDASSHMVHSVDFHAAIGPGGGAALSQTLPGQTKTFTFVATTPGLFVYHCGTPMIADHIANGMYGLILVEPPGGLPHVDHEYYVMQGEIYTVAARGKSGLQSFSEAKLLSESPEYFVFNGATDAVSTEYPLQASVGETVRIFFGNAGPNETSSMHLVGEIFTNEYQLGSLLSPPVKGVQTAGVPPGGAAILEFNAEMPGKFALMDHAISRMVKGLVGIVEVKGQDVAHLMAPGGAAGSGTLAAMGMTAQDARVDTTAESNPTPVPVSDSQSPVRTASANPVASGKAQPSDGIDGCLTFDGTMPKLTLFRSSKFYRLQTKPMLLTERPMLFAKNINTLVHVTGRVTRLTDIYDADHAPVYEVDAVERLAETCSVKQSLSELRRAHEIESQTTQVHMTEMTFSPASIEVSVGARVVWRNTSGAVHNVVDDETRASNAADVALPPSVKPFDSGYLNPGQSFARVFTQPGIYRYVCTLHEANGMKGVILVRPANTTLAAGNHPSGAPSGR